MIDEILQHYYPHWEPPASATRGWVPCLCPEHAENTPSASINRERGAVKCHACGFSGDVISIIRGKEGCTYQEAIGKAKSLTQHSDNDLSQWDSRLPSEQTTRPARFGESRHRSAQQIQVGLRPRPFAGA